MIIIGIAFLLTPMSVGVDKPIPQDQARAAKYFQERLDWNRRTLQGAYDKIGNRDPKWDKPAHEALEVAARYFADPADPAQTFADIYRTSAVAIQAGCNDPLVVYLYSRSSLDQNFPGEEEAARRTKESAKLMASSRYPVFRRAVALRRDASATVIDRNSTPAAKKELQGKFDAVLALLPESVARDEHSEYWENQWFDTIKWLITGYRTVGLKDPEPYQRVDAALAKFPELKVLQLQVRGFFWKAYAWEARTNAFAPLVQEKAMETFERRLTDAQKAYEEAWKLRPDGSQTARAMLEIEKAIGGDRATMEMWFERAMTADCNDRDACWSKLDWLDPKWHGTSEEMLAFGRQCRDTKNWKFGITLLFCDAHLRHYSTLSDNDRNAYLGKPELWDQIKAVFDEYLKHYPNNDLVRSKYAVMCRLAYRSQEAHVQFEKLGDRLTQWTEFPFVPMEEMKRMRADSREIAEYSQKGSPKKKGNEKGKP